MFVQDFVIEVVCRLATVRPNERDDGADDEQQRVVEQEFPDFFHSSSLKLLKVIEKHECVKTCQKFLKAVS